MCFVFAQVHQLDVVLSKKRDPVSQTSFLATITGVSTHIHVHAFCDGLLAQYSRLSVFVFLPILVEQGSQAVDRFLGNHC